MGTAMAVGAVGVHALVQSGRASYEIKPLRLGAILGGAVLFGTGLAVLGYCPGTTLAAVGEGRRDALAGASACSRAQRVRTRLPEDQAGARSGRPGQGDVAATRTLALAMGGRARRAHGGRLRGGSREAAAPPRAPGAPGLTASPLQMRAVRARHLVGEGVAARAARGHAPLARCSLLRGLQPRGSSCT